MFLTFYILQAGPPNVLVPEVTYPPTLPLDGTRCVNNALINALKNYPFDSSKNKLKNRSQIKIDIWVIPQSQVLSYFSNHFVQFNMYYRHTAIHVCTADTVQSVVCSTRPTMSHFIVRFYLAGLFILLESKHSGNSHTLQLGPKNGQSL